MLPLQLYRYTTIAVHYVFQQQVASQPPKLTSSFPTRPCSPRAAYQLKHQSGHKPIQSYEAVNQESDVATLLWAMSDSSERNRKGPNELDPQFDCLSKLKKLAIVDDD